MADGASSFPSNGLFIVHVQARVRSEAVSAFREATLANARASLQEPGVLRFDVLQDREDATRFVLVEVYRTEAAVAAHKDTEHYRTWRDTVAELMAEPRSSRKLTNVFPNDSGF